MKIPSIEEAIMMFWKGLQAFEKEIEEFIEAVVDKLKEMFGK